MRRYVNISLCNFFFYYELDFFDSSIVKNDNVELNYQIIKLLKMYILCWLAFQVNYSLYLCIPIYINLHIIIP